MLYKLYAYYILNNDMFFIYYVCNEKDFKKYKNDKLILFGEFKNNDVKYMLFYVMEDLEIEILKKNSIIALSYKVRDDFIMNRNNDKVSTLWGIIKNQNLYREYFPGNFPTVDIMEIASNKIQYTKFLSDFGITDKKIVVTKNPNINDIRNRKNMVIKLPYSSTSQCVFLNTNNITGTDVKIDECYMKEGYVVEKFNNSTGELKINTSYGKIMYSVYYDEKPKLKIIVDKDFNCENKHVENILKDHKDKIISLVEKIYWAMNLLIEIKKYKIDKELNLYDKIKNKSDDKKYKDLMNSLFYNYKINYIKSLSKDNPDDINIKNLLILLYQSFYDFYLENKIEPKFSDSYLRIDIKLPDYVNYHDIMFVELDSYTCGKSKIIAKTKTSDFKFSNSFYIIEEMKNSFDKYKKEAKNNILNLKQ